MASRAGTVFYADHEIAARDRGVRNMTFSIQRMDAADWAAVESIYLEGVATGNATLETGSPGWDIWDASHHQFGRFVACCDESVMGWAALSPVSGRCVYGGVGEVSVYVSASARGMGLGRELLLALIDECEKNGIWTMQAGILPENTASLRLHEACGFREVGRRERLGKLNGVWRDVVLLERRSTVVGVD